MSEYVADLLGAIEEFTPLLVQMSEEATEVSPSVHPIGDENVRLVRIGIVAVRSPDDLFAIRAEHRESIERGCRRHLLEPGPVRIDQKEIEIAEPGIGVVIR
jgi:hypothetical protein